MRHTLDDLAKGVAAGERPALARALSLAERDPAAAVELLARLTQRLGRAHVIGITGPPGAGKSTLVGVILRQFLESGRSVAVLAVDPSSPVSGGALLGDRFRIGEASAGGRGFVRSTATRGRLGGLTAAARPMVDLLDAAGFDLVLVETVGTGQSEIDIAGLADSILLAFPPGLGDEMQAVKAGILELADVLVVTKSDLAGAAAARLALQAAAPLWRGTPAIHSVSALTGEGIAGLAEALLAREGTRRRAACRVDGFPHFARGAPLDALEKLRSELQRRLPAALAAGLSLEPVNMDGTLPTAGLEVQCRLAPDSDAFGLGAVAGALIVLAGDMHLSVTLQQFDPACGSLRLTLGGAAWSCQFGLE